MNLPPAIPECIVLTLIFIGWFVPGLGDALLNPIERLGKHLAEKKGLAILTVAVIPVLVRIGLLGIFPIPAPQIHDEFSHLLIADTFMHGRLTNPPHSMAVYFDTIHVNQHPTYMSIYPPAQGAFLAVGQSLGHPWIGVVLSVAIMCATVLWMLQGWLPPQWALVGGALFVLRFGIFGDWMNSYWGGAPAAIGGALVLGAMVRVIRFRRSWDAVILAFGAFVLATSRPFEGVILCLPVFVVLLVWLRGRRSPSWRYTVPRFVVPMIVLAILSGTFLGYYNWRGTGNPSLSPYEVNIQNHFSVPLFAWQHDRPPIHFENPQFGDYYNVWWPDLAWQEGRPNSPRNILAILRLNGMQFCDFYLWPALYVPFVTIFWIVRDRRIRFLLVSFAISFLGYTLIACFYPRYAAPLAGLLFAILTQGMRHLRRWRWNGRSAGVGLSRALVLSAVIVAPVRAVTQHTLDPRARVMAQLDAMPGNHLVVVRYTEDHDPNWEWVYNRADIDHAKVVWAREIPDVPLQPLFDYFRGRHFWLVEPDTINPTLSLYPGAPRPK